MLTGMVRTTGGTLDGTAEAGLPAMNEHRVMTLAKFFRALGDRTRLRLLEFLLDEEHTVSECVAHVGLSQGRVSTHLSCLADCGYVQVRRSGRHAYYRVTDPRVTELLTLARAFSDDHEAEIDFCERIDTRVQA